MAFEAIPLETCDMFHCMKKKPPDLELWVLSHVGPGWGHSWKRGIGMTGSQLSLAPHFENAPSMGCTHCKAQGKQHHGPKHMWITICRRGRVLMPTPQECEGSYTYK
jgi:hypothetical protein